MRNAYRIPMPSNRLASSTVDAMIAAGPEQVHAMLCALVGRGAILATQAMRIRREIRAAALRPATMIESD
jgi:hypothetical protein